jgi:hypothetical protein
MISSQVIYLSILGRSSSDKDLIKQIMIISCQDPTWLSLLKIFYPLESLLEGVAQNLLKKEEFSWLSKSKFHFLRISQPLWAISLNWIFIPFLLPFQA